MLPRKPSDFLSKIVVDRRHLGSHTEAALASRLAALGIDEGQEPVHEEVQKLLREVALTPEDLRRDERVPQNPGFEPEPDGGEPAGTQGWHELRRMLNEETRQLFSFSFLSEYRERPTRQPPRLTIYVVGDMSEPFTRATLRSVLRQIHAELLRAFSPIFELYREGFDRSLSVVPILWMPHPSDPFQGGMPSRNRCEEAAIVDAIHGVRRWVESILPAARRRVSQIFIESRVTDNAVLSLRDAVRQTRDFISFQIRNDISQDDWLRRTAIGPQGDDLFASFACYEINFPAERCREYLANRLGRDCLAQIKQGPTVQPEEPPAFEPPKVEDLIEGPRRELHRLTDEAARRVGSGVESRMAVDLDTSSRDLLRAFDEELEAALQVQVQQIWEDLTHTRGRMDEMVDALRRDTAGLLSTRLTEVRGYSDGLIEQHTGRGGLAAAQACLDRLRLNTRDVFQKREELRRRAEELCRHHSIPDISPLAAARASLLAAARRKPDRQPLWVGLGIWLLLALVLGAPLAHAVAYFFNLHLRPNALELLLGPLGWLPGGAVLFLLAWYLLERHLRSSVERVRLRIADLAEAARRIVRGLGEDSAKEPRASVRSFFDARLLLTGALATRGYTLRVLERAVADGRLAYRLSRSIDVQAHLLAQRAEALGVRPKMVDGRGGRPEDDVRGLFATRSGEVIERLIRPEALLDHYSRRMGGDEDVVAALPEFIHEGGGFADWRKVACLSDTDRVLAFCRATFQSIVTTPIPEQDAFAEEVGRRLCRFVASRYSNIGYGAKFMGYEGLDPDGVRVSAEAALIVHPSMKTVFENARRSPGSAPTTATMEVIPVQVRPNAAYMLSLVQGIRPHSVSNLKRFESFHDRVHMPDDRTFPLSQEEEHGSPPPINHMTSHLNLGDRLRDALRSEIPPPPSTDNGSGHG